MDYISKCFCKEFEDYIFKEFKFMFIPRSRDIERVCLVPSHISLDIDEISLSNIRVLAAGILVGWIKKKKKFIPSPYLFELAIEKGFKFGCAVVAKTQGVKAFLYGNDILVSSVEKFLQPVEKGMYVAVLDAEDLRVIGIGKLVIDSKDFDEHVRQGKMLSPVVENVFDLGVLLRNELYI